jgi:hypothetical protein
MAGYSTRPRKDLRESRGHSNASDSPFTPAATPQPTRRAGVGTCGVHAETVDSELYAASNATAKVSDLPAHSMGLTKGLSTQFSTLESHTLAHNVSSTHSYRRSRRRQTGPFSCAPYICSPTHRKKADFFSRRFCSSQHAPCTPNKSPGTDL